MKIGSRLACTAQIKYFQNDDTSGNAGIDAIQPFWRNFYFLNKIFFFFIKQLFYLNFYSKIACNGQ
jgi:hypothetical protein